MHSPPRPVSRIQVAPGGSPARAAGIEPHPCGAQLPGSAEGFLQRVKGFTLLELIVGLGVGGIVLAMLVQSIPPAVDAIEGRRVTIGGQTWPMAPDLAMGRQAANLHASLTLLLSRADRVSVYGFARQDQREWPVAQSLVGLSPAEERHRPVVAGEELRLVMEHWVGDRAVCFSEVSVVLRMVGGRILWEVRLLEEGRPERRYAFAEEAGPGRSRSGYVLTSDPSGVWLVQFPDPWAGGDSGAGSQRKRFIHVLANRIRA